MPAGAARDHSHGESRRSAGAAGCRVVATALRGRGGLLRQAVGIAAAGAATSIFSRFFLRLFPPSRLLITPPRSFKSGADKFVHQVGLRTLDRAADFEIHRGESRRLDWLEVVAHRPEELTPDLVVNRELRIRAAVRR